MREELKRLIGENISGTAKCIKNGRRCLLRDIKIDDPNAFDPDIYLSITQHLWTDSSIIKKIILKDILIFNLLVLYMNTSEAIGQLITLLR